MTDDSNTTAPDQTPPGAATAAGPVAVPGCSATLVQEIAAEALDLAAWILTPEDGYEPVAEPASQLLHAVCCRMQQQYEVSGPALCAQVTEAATLAVLFTRVLQTPPGQAPATATAEDLGLRARVDQISRARLPELMRAAASYCRYTRLATPRPHPGS